MPNKKSYQLLWQDLKKSTTDNSAISVFNNMRRILEYYYNILGGTDYESLVNIFEPSEKMAFRSLISWINDGSHYTYDELFIDIGNSNIELHMKIFKEIFDKN